MVKVIVKQVKKAALPASAPNNVLVLVTDTGMVYKGTGDGLIPYSAVLDYNTFSEFPIDPMVDKIYRANDTNILYTWDETEEEYIPINFIKGMDVVKVTDDIILTDADTNKTYTTIDVTKSITIRLPVLQDNLYFHILHESDSHSCSVVTHNDEKHILIPNRSKVEKVSVKPNGSVEFFGSPTGWRILGLESVQSIMAGIRSVQIIDAEITSGWYTFNHNLNFYHINVLLYDSDNKFIGSPDEIEIINKNNIRIKLTSRLPISTYITATALLGGDNIQPKVQYGIKNEIVEVSPSMEILELDYTQYGLIHVQLNNNAIFALKPLASIVSKVVHLIVKQSSTLRYNVYLADSNVDAAYADIWSERGFIYTTPTIGNIDVITLVWDGHKFIWDTDVLDIVKQPSQLSPVGFGIFYAGWNGYNVNLADKFDWVLETKSNANGYALSTPRYGAASIANASYGLVCGGYSSQYENIIDKADWILETTSVGSFALNSAKAHLAGCSNSIFGVIAGGKDASYFNTAEKVIWNGDVAIETPSYELSKARSHLAACGNRAYGIFGGGLAPNPVVPDFTNTCDILDWATEESHVVPSIYLLQSRMGLAAVSNYYYGLFIGGMDDGLAVNTDKIDWASQVISARPSFNLTNNRVGISAAGNVSYAVVAGGQSITNVAVLDKLNYLDETSQVIGSYTLSEASAYGSAAGNANPSAM